MAHQARHIGIGVAAMVALLGGFVALREQPSDATRATLSLPAPTDVTRISLTGPGDASVTVARRTDGWWLTEPVESPVSRERNAELAKIVSGAFIADSITFSADKAKDYEVSDELGTTVSMFTDDSATPKHTLVIGKSITVQSTRARRTYVRVPGEDTIHRLQVDLSALRDADLFAWRDKSILQILDRDALSSFTVTIKGASPETYTIGKRGEGWAVRAPEEARGTRLEDNAIGGIVSALTNLRAKGFVDGTTPGELGLAEPPEAKIELEVGDETIALYASSRDGTYYALRRGLPFVYELNQVDFERLFKPLISLRALDVLALDASRLTGFTLAGEDRVKMQRSGDGWSMLAPKKVASVPEEGLSSLVSFLTGVRAARYVTTDIDASGTRSPSDLVSLETTEGTFTIGLGDEVASEGPDAGSRYARILDTEDVFVLSEYNVERLGPTADAVLPKPKDAASAP